MTQRRVGDRVAKAGTAPVALQASDVRALLPWSFAVLATALALLVRSAVDPLLGNQLPYVSFFVAVTVTAYLATPGATVLAILLGFLAATWFFIPPRHTFALASSADAVGLVAYFVVCGFIAGMSHLTSTAKTRALVAAAELARRKEQVEAEIAERLRAEEALNESESRFRELAESMPQIVYEVDAEGLTYFNQRWSDYTGRQEAGRNDHVELIHPDDRERTREAWMEAVRSRSPYECELRFRRHDGVHRWFLSRAVPVLADPGGEIARWLGTLTDIHDVKLAQESLRDADRQKNAFLAILSHELRNPLAPIKNSLLLLERASPGSEQAMRAHAVIARQVEQLTRLVDDLLEVTRITRNKIQLRREHLDLNALVRGTVEDHRPSFEKNEVRLELTTGPTPVFVDGDRNRLAQVVGNLLQNAVKFSEPGGRTVVDVSADPDRARATLRVADTGAGLAPEMLERLFQPFMQADNTLDRSKGGLGLGLALVKSLAELHGGEVRAHSEGVGRGAEFVVHLPLAAEKPFLAAPVRAGSAPRNRRVLIIEDNVDAANTLREVLELSGHEVVVAHSGPEGIERSRELRPEVVLCDIGLPGMDGYGVARALRSDPALGSTFLVAVSGYALADDVQRAYAAGFERHLSKPLSLRVLEEVLAAAPAAGPRAETDPSSRDQQHAPDASSC